MTSETSPAGPMDQGRDPSETETVTNGSAPSRKTGGLHIMSLSVHGLVRGRDMELGRDADTGGQVSYVVDQARALAKREEVEQVDVVTRQIWDRRVDESYSQAREELSEGARIVRLAFGPRRYLRKETLWPYLPLLVDQILRYVRDRGRAPDLIHGHYADAGFVGAQVAKILGVPFLFTGHSLGQVKIARLLDQGQDEEALEERYRFSRRVEAESQALETAAVVIASTRQEVREQYQLYDHYQPHRMEVIPPGVDVSRFFPLWEEGPSASRGESGGGSGTATARGGSDGPAGSAKEEAEESGPEATNHGIRASVNRFLRDPSKPIILAMARADERKNFATLLQAYGENRELRKKANLLLVAGNREDIREMPGGARRVLTDILVLIDRYDLYGSVAIPKEHRPEEVPLLYRMAAESGGVFVNPALTEPFGLTIIEAAASGLPVVATNDGGPQDIMEACRNGLLVEPTDAQGMGKALLEALGDRSRWEEWSRNGVRGVHQRFTWESHAKRYLEVVRNALGGELPTRDTALPMYRRSRLPRMDRIVVTDIDNTLTGNPEALEAFLRALEDAGSRVGFAVATGRPLPLALEALDELGIPIPDLLISATGTEIHYGQPPVEDSAWRKQIHYHWEPDRIMTALKGMEGLEPLHDEPMAPYRLRFRLSGPDAPDLPGIRRALRSVGLRVTATLDHGKDLDITPIRASPGLAIRFLAHKWSLPPDRFLVAGDSGNDADMLAGEMLGVVVGNHTPELEALRGHPRIHFSAKNHAWGVLDGIRHYDFFGSIRIPETAEPEPEGE
jgi:sucrose-phosphate synthase